MDVYVLLRCGEEGDQFLGVYASEVAAIEGLNAHSPFKYRIANGEQPVDWWHQEGRSWRRANTLYWISEKTLAEFELESPEIEFAAIAIVRAPIQNFSALGALAAQAE